jgi:hypothetical protein
VIADYPVQIISKCVVIATEGSCRIVSNGEETCGLDLIDLFERRLPYINPKVVDVRSSRERAAGCVFNLIAETEIVQYPSAKIVNLRDQRVVVANSIILRITKNITYPNAGVVETVVEVPQHQVVFCPYRLIDAAGVFDEILAAWTEELVSAVISANRW